MAFNKPLEPNYKTLRCPCSEGKHIIDISEPQWQFVYSQIEQHGETINTFYLPTKQRFLVPRIFIAKHGLKGKELPKLGFQEVEDVNKKSNKLKPL